MSRLLNAYTRYDETANTWIPRIPTHWAFASCGHRYEVLLGKMLDGSRVTGTNTAAYLRNVDVQWDRINEEDLPTMDFAPNEVARYSVRKGDLLVCEGGEIGRSAIWNKEQPCFYQKALHRLRPRDRASDVSRFMFYHLVVAVSQGRFVAGAGRATIAHLPAEAFRQYRFPYPPLDEQTQIAKFLDYETAKIDKLIDKQQQLIALLQEKRQAVISHAVTKGLNPNARLRDSGVEWLGKVPAHWEVRRIKNLATLISKGTTPSTIGREMTSDGVRFVKAENVGKSIAVSTAPEFFISRATDELLSRSRLKAGDVLVIIAGATTGLCSVVQADLLPANTNQAVSFVRPRRRSHAYLIVRWLSTEFAQRMIWMGAVQAAQPNLSMEDLGNMPIAVPPADELHDILKFIEAKMARFDALANKAASVVELLAERRTALISAAVTGKIDVRNWKPPETSAEKDVA